MLGVRETALVGKEAALKKNRDLQFPQAHLAGGAGILPRQSGMCGLEAAAGGGSSPGDSVACRGVCDVSPAPSIQLLPRMPAINLPPWAVAVEGTASSPLRAANLTVAVVLLAAQRLQVKAKNERDAPRESVWAGTQWVCQRRGGQGGRCGLLCL